MEIPRFVLPANSETLCKNNNTHNANRLEIEEFNTIINNHDDSLPYSSISIDHSSDVVIGSVTQFNGPVTIIQKLEADKGENNTTCFKESDSVSSEKKFEPNKQHSRLLWLIPLVILFLTGATLFTIYQENHTSNSIIYNPNISNTTIGNHRLIKRDEWLGRPQLNFTRPLAHPTKYVLISHTGGIFCKTFLKCSAIMREIQSQHVATNSPDVGYNFLIGGDGNIYEARGWDQINFHMDGCIGISFIGNYIFDSLTREMISATKALLEQGVALKKLSGDYSVVSHNQTYATLSPGGNVYSEIQTWSHFLPGEYIEW